MLDGIDDDRQVFESCRDVFQQQLVFDGKTIHEYVVDAECTEHPALRRVVGQYFGIADVILVTVGRVAFNTDAKHVFDSQFQPVKGCSGKWFSVVQVILDPKSLDSFECYFSAALDSVDQPDILSEGVGGAHFD